MDNRIIGSLGAFLIILGFVLSLSIFIHYTVIFVLGWMFLMIFVNERYFGQSNLVNLKNKKFFLLLLFVGASITLLIEFTRLYLFPVWFYSFNFFNLKFDFWFSIGAYIFYIPATFETFTFLSNLMKFRTKQVLHLDKLFMPFLIVSLLLMSIPFIWSSPSYKGLPFSFFIIGLFFLSDFLNYKVNKNSVITNSLCSLKYCAIIILTSFLISIPSEYTNISQDVWTYVNLPFLNITLFSVPLVILLGWILLVGIWINTYKVILYFSNR